ncbi:MAG: hypothetical protein F4Y86_02845 [Gammaproteobacteria bacterium]|nr:hypothetical protein [Gammaproteobacteria bacterium]MYB39184.1 hypothetical protein [Gammaproteobacteria bacterium]
MEEEGTGSGLVEQAVQLVERCWAEREVPLLLSELGSGEIGKGVRTEGVGLARFVETRLQGRVRLIKHKDVAQLIGVIPWHVDVRDEQHESGLLERTRRATPQGEGRFEVGFWAAFRKPLGSGRTRWVRSEKPVRFEDVREGFSAPDGFIQVERSFIVDPGGDANDVVESMERWSKEVDVPLGTFQRARARTSGEATDDLLGKLLATLDEDEMRRVTMPLDVVNKLRRRD